MTLYYNCPLHELFETAVYTTYSFEDNIIDWKCVNGIPVYSIVLQLDQTGEGCNGSSLTHYALWKFTNTISLLPFLISQTYTYVQYSNVTGVLSLDATCMVSWNHSVEYMDTRSSVCVGEWAVGWWTVGDGEWDVVVLISGRMWPGSFKCYSSDSQFPLSTALLTVSTVCNEVIDHWIYLKMKVAT